MKKVLVLGIALVLSATANGGSARLKNGDPARWYKEDRTAGEHIMRYRKEAAAAFRENKAQCKRDKACLIEAHQIYIAEMNDVMQRLLREIDDYYPR